MPMNATTDAKATAQTDLGWRHMWCGYSFLLVSSCCGRRILEQALQNPNACGKGLPVLLVQRGDVRVDHGGAVGPRLPQGLAARGSDLDQHGPRVGGIRGAGDV